MPRFALSGCFLLSVLHAESSVEGNAVLIGNVDDARSLAVNLNFLFSVTAALVGSVIAQLEDIPHGLRRFFVDQHLSLSSASLTIRMADWPSGAFRISYDR